EASLNHPESSPPSQEMPAIDKRSRRPHRTGGGRRRKPGILRSLRGTFGRDRLVATWASRFRVRERANERNRFLRFAQTARSDLQDLNRFSLRAFGRHSTASAVLEYRVLIGGP